MMIFTYDEGEDEWIIKQEEEGRAESGIPTQDE